MDQAWIDAARAYDAMDERGRYAYWNQLTPEQQAALQEALAASAVQPTAAIAADPKTAGRRGFFGTFAIGCTGVILGVILTIAVEIAAIAKGVGAVTDMLGAPSRPSYSSETPDSEPPPDDRQDNQDRERHRDDDRLDCVSPRNSAERSECSRQRYQERKRNWESEHPGEDYPCEIPGAE